MCRLSRGKPWRNADGKVTARPATARQKSLTNRSGRAHIWHTKRWRKTNLRGVLEQMPLIGKSTPRVRLSFHRPGKTYGRVVTKCRSGTATSFALSVQPIASFSLWQSRASFSIQLDCESHLCRKGRIASQAAIDVFHGKHLRVEFFARPHVHMFIFIVSRVEEDFEQIGVAGCASLPSAFGNPAHPSLFSLIASHTFAERDGLRRRRRLMSFTENTSALNSSPAHMCICLYSS